MACEFRRELNSKITNEELLKVCTYLRISSATPILSGNDLYDYLEHRAIITKGDLSALKQAFISCGYGDWATRIDNWSESLTVSKSFLDLCTSLDSHGASENKAWRPGMLLYVFFMDGTSVLQESVLIIAKLWSAHANITFERTESIEKSHIRITFEGVGFWSAIGMDAMLGRYKSVPTMCLEAVCKHFLMRNCLQVKYYINLVMRLV